MEILFFFHLYMGLVFQILKFMTQKYISPLEYSVIKSGIITIAKYLAKYSKNLNIRINCISHGGLKDYNTK